MVLREIWLKRCNVQHPESVGADTSCPKANERELYKPTAQSRYPAGRQIADPGGLDLRLRVGFLLLNLTINTAKVLIKALSICSNNQIVVFPLSIFAYYAMIFLPSQYINIKERVDYVFIQSSSE